MLQSICLIILVSSAIGCSNAAAPTSPVRLEFNLKQGQPPSDSLYPVFPNPFNRISGDVSIAIQFALKDSGSAQLVIQNVLGDPVTVFSDSLLAPGYYSGLWNPLASDGTRLMNGLYFVTLHNGDFILSRLVDLQENE